MLDWSYVGSYSVKTRVLRAKLILSAALQGQYCATFLASADATFEEDVADTLAGSKRAGLVVLSADLHLVVDDRVADTPFFLLG